MLNELVAASVAPQEDGRSARKRIALPSRRTCERVDRTRPLPGRSATASQACAWRFRTGERKLPRCSRHAVAGGPASGLSLRHSHASETTRLCGCRFVDACSRHRGDHRHVHPDQRCSAEAAAFFGRRQTCRREWTVRPVERRNFWRTECRISGFH